MKISEILNQNKPVISFEVFPPKTDDAYETVKTAASEIAKLNPIFMSVTCHAVGSNQHTIDIASEVQNQFHVTALAHVTCYSVTRETLPETLKQLQVHGIENILALRGDIPAGMDFPSGECSFKHACELTAAIKEFGGFCIGGACYPEGHPEAINRHEDILHLKEKVDAGAEFLTSQLFFDNSTLFSFLYRAREAGIKVPILAGIMPVTNAKQMEKSCRLSGSELPGKLKAIFDKFGDNPAAMKEAGIAYATEQIIELIANGENYIHVYTMNKPDVAEKIRANLSDIIE